MSENWLKTARVRSHVTQRELADLVDVGTPHISKVERGLESPSLNLVTKLCEVLGIGLKPTLLAAGRCPECGAKPEHVDG